MPQASWHLNRRTFLRGAGLSLALPWLESLAPRGAQAQAMGVPKRFVPIFFPCGAACHHTLGRRENIDSQSPQNARNLIARNVDTAARPRN